MDVEELAILLGMNVNALTEEDIMRLQLQIDSGIEFINQYFKSNGCDIVLTPCNLTAGFKIALKQYAEISETASGVTSENVGGLSLTYGNSSSSGASDLGRFKDLTDYLDLFCCQKKQVRFIPLKR